MSGFQHGDLESFLAQRLASARAAFDSIDEAPFLADPAAVVACVRSRFALDPVGVASREEIHEPRIEHHTAHTDHVVPRQRVTYDIAVTGPHFLWNYRPTEGPPMPAVTISSATSSHCARSSHGTVSSHLFHAGPMFVLTISGEHLDVADIDAALGATLTALTELADHIDTDIASFDTALRTPPGQCLPPT